MKATLDAEATYPPLPQVRHHGCVKLGRIYFVYEFDSWLVVRGPRRRRAHETVERCYDKRDVLALGSYYAGRTVTADQALFDIRTGRVQVPVVSYGGRALKDVRDMFLALCGLGLARVCRKPVSGPAFTVKDAA